MDRFEDRDMLADCQDFDLFLDLAEENLNVGLEMLDCRNIDLSLCSRPAEKMANVICNTKEVILWGTQLTTTQLDTICRAISDTDISALKIRKLNLKGINNVKEIKAETFASAMCRVEKYVIDPEIRKMEEFMEFINLVQILYGSEITFAYIMSYSNHFNTRTTLSWSEIHQEAMIDAVRNCPVLRLKKLALCGDTLTNLLATDNFTSAICRLEEVLIVFHNHTGTLGTGPKSAALFKAIAEC